MKIIEREAFHVCGYAAQTTTEQNEVNLSALYDDFFEGDKEAVLRSLHGSKKGYYRVLWYTNSHEKYYYLIGIEVAEGNNAPENTMLMTAIKTTYAVASYPHDKDAIEAWGEFFYTDIPNSDYTVNAPLNFYFEYYPESINSDYELWVPVVNSDA